MQLDVVVRGQSNAILFLEHGRYAAMGQMIDFLELLLGFDGVQNRVNVVFDRDGVGGDTAFGGTAFLGDWMGRDPTGNWQPTGLESLFLQRMAQYRTEGPGDATAVLWLHSESDSRNAGLSPAEWQSAVQTDMALTRSVLGRDVPYLFVAAHPYGDGTDAGHQAIRQGMEALAGNPANNARIAARAPDIDTNNDDLDGRWWTQEYGGAHLSPSDAMLIAPRVARSLAEAFAAYAQPGSIMERFGGNIAADGPRAIAATHASPTALRVDVLHDHSPGFAPFDPDATSGLGWSARLPDGRRIEASLALPADGDTLLVYFGEAVPRGALVDYAYGIGRLARGNEPGSGNAIYDQSGLPLWTPATGLPVSTDPFG